MKRNALLHECLSEISDEVREEMDLSHAIADRIDATLKAKGMSQKDLANAMGKDEAEVSRWLCGTHNFTIRTLAKISHILDTPIVFTSPNDANMRLLS